MADRGPIFPIVTAAVRCGAFILSCVLLLQITVVGNESNGRIPCNSELQQKHNALGAEAGSAVLCFQAFISNFDTRVIDGRALGIPLWVAYEVDKGTPRNVNNARPSKWYTVRELVKKHLAPTDDSYVTSDAFRSENTNWYQRGHLAPKFLAERLGRDAGRYSHNIVNAVPQLALFNRGPWFQLECETGAWANKYGSVWVLTGPVFLVGRPSDWLEPDDAMPVAIPDALFKIIARRVDQGNDHRFQLLAFLLPQASPSYARRHWDIARWRTSVERIRDLTGLRLLDPQVHFDEAPVHELWPLHAEDFDRGCRRFSPD